MTDTNSTKDGTVHTVVLQYTVAITAKSNKQEEDQIRSVFFRTFFFFEQEFDKACWIMRISDRF